MSIVLIVAVAVSSFVLGICWTSWMIVRSERRYQARKAEYMQKVYEAICSKYNIPTSNFQGINVPDDMPDDL